MFLYFKLLGKVGGGDRRNGQEYSHTYTEWLKRERERGWSHIMRRIPSNYVDLQRIHQPLSLSSSLIKSGEFEPDWAITKWDRKLSRHFELQTWLGKGQTRQEWMESHESRTLVNKHTQKNSVSFTHINCFDMVKIM